MHCKVPPFAPYKSLENFSKALYGTTGGTYSAQVFRPVMDAIFHLMLNCLVISIKELKY